MADEFRNSPFFRRVSRWALASDAWLNSTVYEIGRAAQRVYGGYAAFMERFHVFGWRRWAVEAACEGLTLGLGGAILALALAIPAFRETSDDWLKKQELAVTFLDRNGQEVGRRGIRHNDSAPLEQMPEHLIHAALATEDRRFFEHFGIDIIGTARALTVNARSSGVVQGGSSITQQLAKNLFLSNERTIERKIKEAFLALWLEANLSKRDILKLYLDRAYMGAGNFGVQAASDFYFGKNVRDLSLAEAAMLAGLFKAPTKFAPHVNLPAARVRANDVLNNMVDAGYLTRAQIHAAQQNPATPVDRRRDSTPDWYLDWAYDEVKKLSTAGKLGDDRVLTVRIALDSALQKQAETIVEDHLRQSGPSYHAKQSAVVIMEPTGAVRAIVGGRDYGASQFNRATDALRQPGSSFKPFVYMTALLTGRFKPSTIVVDSPICIGNWCPNNYGGSYSGSAPLSVALAKSLNTVAVKLSINIGEAYWPKGRPYHQAKIAELGRSKIIETARRMGLNSPLTDTVSLPIGAAEVTVIDMASAYAVFANGGWRATPYAALEASNSHGDVIYRHDRDAKPAEQLFNTSVVADMVGMMNKVVEEGTARRAILEGGHKSAGKTGTTNSYKDAWFVGYTGNMVGAVWYGNDDNSDMANMTGGSLPAQTWHDIMAFAHLNLPPKPLPGLPLGNAVAASSGSSGSSIAEMGAPQRPATLTPKAVESLGAIEKMFRSGRRADAGGFEPTEGRLAARNNGPSGADGFRVIGGHVETR